MRVATIEPVVRWRRIHLNLPGKAPGFKRWGKLQLAVWRGAGEDDPLDVAAVQIPVRQPAVTFEAHTAIDFGVADQRTTTSTALLEYFQPLQDQGFSNTLPLPSRPHRNRPQTEPVFVAAVDRDRRECDMPYERPILFGH